MYCAGTVYVICIFMCFCLCSFEQLDINFHSCLTTVLILHIVECTVQCKYTLLFVLGHQITAIYYSLSLENTRERTDNVVVTI